MKQQKWNIIGLMSGTSLDGVDLVYVTFSFKSSYQFDIHCAKTYSYSESWIHKLSNAFNGSALEITQLTSEYGRFLGNLINQFIKEFNILDIDFVASHGHTIFHNPAEKYTLQIGDGASIAAITNLKVVCDFRSQDVALGGQGAPLVPIGDQLLFSEYDYCLNLGGFANISYQENGKRKAFDICPVNTVLNYYAQQFGVPFDDAGKLASEGLINHKLLEALNQLDFYKSTSPKSLGIEFVNAEIFPLIDKFSLSEEDVLRTYVEHIAITISDKVKLSKIILITGGGVFNTFLIERIRSVSKCTIVIPSEKLINFKEALIFSFLGLLKIENQINCLQSVTGARKDHSSGIIYNS